MPIHKLIAANFKGIDGEQSFEIKPITLFIGPNSSGKSSCIHALGCLAQTVKGNPGYRPIILDDEYAQIHLGRFIEVIHSRSYTNSITLGLDVGPNIRPITGTSRTVLAHASSTAMVKFQFKSTKRTQDIYLSQAWYSAAPFAVEAKPKARGPLYELTRTDVAQKMNVAPPKGLIFDFLVRGISGTSYDLAAGLNAIQRRISLELTRTQYLGPFRQAPQRRYPSRGSNPIEVGASGESAITMLSNEYVRTKTRPHLKKISQWLAMMGLAKSIDVERVGRSDLFDVNLALPDGATIPLADLGYGLSQVLPVLVQCSFAPRGGTLLFEQPELHLHHGAARMLAKVFIETVRTQNTHIVAETHSKDLFLQLFQELRDGAITLDDIAIYEVKREAGASVFTRVKVTNEDGEFGTDHPWYTGLDAT